MTSFSSYIARFAAAIVVGLLLIASHIPLCAAIERPETVINTQVGIFTVLGTKVDLGRTFTDSDGRVGPLKSFVSAEKPTIIIPVYYKCPRLCGLVMDGVMRMMDGLPLTLGQDFDVVFVSFNPRESAADARESLTKFSTRLSPPVLEQIRAVKFLVGSSESISPLMNELGFRYLPDGEDFAHSAGIMILTPGGEISQYFTGIEFSPWDVRLALVEASKGAIGTAIDHLLLYCFRFDPLQGKYTWAVVGLLRVGGALTLVGLAAMYLFFMRKSLFMRKSASKTGM